MEKDVITEATIINAVDISDIYTAAEEAVKNNIPEKDFIKSITIAFVNKTSDSELEALKNIQKIQSDLDLEALKNIQKIQDDARSCYNKAEETKKVEEAKNAEAEVLEKYRSFHSSDRILFQLTETMMAFGNSKIAEVIHHMLIENASQVKIAAMIGANKSDKETMDQIKYVYNAIKKEKELSIFSTKFVRVFEELCDK